MNRKSWTALGVAALLGGQALIWFVYRGVEDRRHRPQAPAEFAFEPLQGSSPGLDVALDGADGSAVSFAELVREPLVLHFWATWCAPCRTELPTLLELAKSSQRDGRPRVVLVSVDENWEPVRHFFDGQVPPEVLLDGSGRLKAAFDVRTFPETYLLRAGGTLEARVRGPRDWSPPLSLQVPPIRKLLGK